MYSAATCWCGLRLKTVVVHIAEITYGSVHQTGCLLSESSVPMTCVRRFFLSVPLAQLAPVHLLPMSHLRSVLLFYFILCFFSKTCSNVVE